MKKRKINTKMKMKIKKKLNIRKKWKKKLSYINIK